jgi:hypothetical protein
MAERGVFHAIAALITSLIRYTGYDWNHSGSSPLRSSSNTTSPMHPHRPIKPLPKRRLRARLSPEQVQSIVYPPVPQSATPLFSFPHSPAESRASLRAERRRGESDQHACHCGGQHHGEAESEDDDEHERGRPLPSSPSYDYSRSRPGKAAGAAYPKPASTASSGEESFENTNNKKKRKIPNMGGTSAHHSSLSAEMASMGISHPHDGVGIEDGDGPGRYYASAPSTPQHNAAGTGIAGAGRGRFGRSASGRTERRILHSSANLANAKANNKRMCSHHLLGRSHFGRLACKSPCTDLFSPRTPRPRRHHLNRHRQRPSNAAGPGQREREPIAARGGQDAAKNNTVHLHLRL